MVDGTGRNSRQRSDVIAVLPPRAHVNVKGAAADAEPSRVAPDAASQLTREMTVLGGGFGLFTGAACGAMRVAEAADPTVLELIVKTVGGLGLGAGVGALVGMLAGRASKRIAQLLGKRVAAAVNGLVTGSPALAIGATTNGMNAPIIWIAFALLTYFGYRTALDHLDGKSTAPPISGHEH